MGPENAWGGMKSQKVYKMKHPRAVIHLWAIKNNYMMVVLGGFLPTLRWGKFRLSALYSFGARLS